jgi:hypothetical protein
MSLPTKRRRSKKRTKEEKIQEFKIGIEKVRMEKLRSQRGCYSQFLSPIVALLSPLPSRNYSYIQFIVYMDDPWSLSL